MAGIWTPERRRAASARLKARHGEVTAVRWTDARRAAHAAAVRRAHAEGRYDGAALGRPRQRAYWPNVREARVGSQIRITHHQILQGPLWELWTIGPTVETAHATDVDQSLRMREHQRSKVVGVPGWEAVHAPKRAAELQRLIAEQQADVVTA